MIRKAHLEDLPTIQQLYFNLFEIMADIEPQYMKAAKQDETFIKSVIQGENDFTIFIAEEDSQVQGFAIAQLQTAPPYNCYVQQHLIYLMDLVVTPHNRGKGYGKALIQAVKDWGIINKVDYFELNVLAHNKQAIELYLKEGLETFSQSMRMRLDNQI